MAPREAERDGAGGQDVLRRAGDASVLILTSLAGGAKHGYALIKDVKGFAGVELGPAEDRRHPYRITPAGVTALRVHLDAIERVRVAGRLRLGLEGI